MKGMTRNSLQLWTSGHSYGKATDGSLPLSSLPILRKVLINATNWS